MNETGRRVREQYADTGGFTDVFAACSILGYAFVPRIRDLPSKRLRAGVPKRLRPLVGGKVNVDLIDRNWADSLNKGRGQPCPHWRRAPPSSRAGGSSGCPTDVEAARQQLQRLMRDAEGDIAEALSGSAAR